MGSFENAKKEFSSVGVDVEKALDTLNNIPISLHCWQGDDVEGFEGTGALSGGIAVTGNYMGKASGAKQLMDDFKFTLDLLGGKKRINLHASYAISDTKVERDCITYKQFAPWVEFAKVNNLGIDFNPTFFSHPMVKNGLTLSSPDKSVRDYWIRHAKACRKISEQIAKELNSPVLCNIWIPDGFKEIPADRTSPRMRLKDSLDQIYSENINRTLVLDCVESKVFGIGVESYTVGSHEFYMSYATENKIMCLLDNGHFHPTENVADKISSLLAFNDKIALHITRSVRWDSDHVVLLNDEVKEIANEIVCCDAIEKTCIGLDYFDASINRISAWATGARNVQKAFMIALCQPHDKYKKLQNNEEYTKLMLLRENCKMLPYGEIYKEFLKRNGLQDDITKAVFDYEEKVLSKRGN